MSISPFKTVRTVAAPIAIKDVDTDMIIPAQYLTSISRDGFAAGLFSRLRTTIPEFYMNQPKFASAQVLIADSNFGCGSSREHAVWALMGAGVRVIIAKSFADIFASNSAKNGLLLITLPADTVDKLLSLSIHGDYVLQVNLEDLSITDHLGARWSFSYDTFRRYCLLNGLDDLDYLRSHAAQILKHKESLSKNFFFDARHPNRGSL